MNTRIAPQSKESEMMVLGCMLTSINSLNIAADRLEDSDFYFPEHQKIFKVMKQAYLNERPADVHLVCEELKRQGTLAGVGGVPFIVSLAQAAGSSAFIDEYVEIVRSKALLRQMIDAAQKVEKIACSEPDDVYQALDQSQQHFFSIGQSAHPTVGVSIKDLLNGVKSLSKIPFLKELQTRQERFQLLGQEAGAIAGIPSHFLDVDKLLGGFYNSNLMILAARPAMGKTAFAINVAENICFKNRIPVGIFSLEMSAEQLLHRMICSQAEVESEKIKTGSLTGVEYQRIVAAAHEMGQHTMIIDDQPGLKITDLRARARRMKETYKIGFLVIDYLQLLSGSGTNRNMDRHLEISEISRMLKNLARELDIPILCLSQLSRKVEERQGHRPQMSDLRESGSIEQDADVVMFLLRREYYDPLDKPGLAELIIGKNRHGAVGNVLMVYRKTLAQFQNYTGSGQGGAPSAPTGKNPAFAEFE